MNSGLNLYLPLVYNNQDGPYKTTKTLKQAVSQNLRLLFLTNPGERVMDINFGVGIKRFLFENITTSVLERLNERIRTQILKYMGYLTIVNLDIAQSTTANALFIKMTFGIPGINEIALFALDVQESKK